MGSAQSNDTPVNETALVEASGSKRQAMLNDLVKKHRQAEEQDFYEMFGLERYADMSGTQKSRLKCAYHALLRQWHPDKHPQERREECHVYTVKICLAKKVLEDPDLKRRYDIELREQRHEADTWSTASWYAAWGFQVAATLGGVTLIIAGAAGAVVSGGATTTACVAGGALLQSGVKGAIKLARDPNCSTTELVKDNVIGALQGAAAGGIGAGAGVCMQGAAALAQVSIGVGAGAATSVSSDVISDAADLLISSGCAGKHLKDNVTDAKTTSEVFTLQNGGKILRGAAVGAALGGGLTVVGQAVGAGSRATGNLADDAVMLGRQKAGDMAIEGMSAALRMTSKMIADAVLEPVLDRVKKINPDVAHLLVNDASRADFMLSRTNIQKDFADRKVVSILEEGFKVCADNSLKGGWGGRGWCKRYVEDSKKTRFGILVLEGGEGFFESTPCCDELYAAKRAGINLTKVNGESIHSGQYLWVEVADDRFDTHGEYERQMRRKHGQRYTPTWYTATLGGHYDPSLEGTKYTYYCIVPQGRAASATGADKQFYPE